ncbi:MAG TPA: hypothetical protein VE504_00760 [Nitrososphaeraceae archaeon]|nr:hypothetical protein [Nitrososphaeraceae archaeon]
MDLNREARKLTDDFKEKTHRFVEDFTIAESLLDSEYEEEQRLRRMVEIHYKANDVRVARCEAKMKEVGGQQAFLDLIESGKWSDRDRTRVSSSQE